jgi:hypothetical protein
MNWSKQLGLAVALFTLGSVAYWAEYRKKPDRDAENDQAKKIFRLKATPVESIKIVNLAKSVELHCLDFAAKQCQPGDNSKWEIVSPLKMRGDDPNTNGMVSSLSNLDAADTIDLKEETPEKRAALLKEYGLDAATRAARETKRIEVKTGEKLTVLYLGQTHPIGEGLFAIAATNGSIDENKVYVVPSYFKSNLEHALTYWRDKKLVTLASHEIGSFQLKTSRVDLQGTRTGGIWRVKINGGPEKGEELPGDSENIDNLLNGATFLVAKEFVADHKDDARGKAVLRSARPLLTFTANKEKYEPQPSAKPGEPAVGDSVVLSLYQKNAPITHDDKKPMKVVPVIYATVSNLDPVFELEPYSRDRLDKELKDLRLSKLISAMERFQIKKLEFAGPTGPLSLSYVDNKWISSSPDQSELNQDKVQAFLDKFSGTKVKAFMARKIVPKPAKPEYVLHVTITGDEKTPLRREFNFWRDVSGLFAEDTHSPRKDKEGYMMEPGLTDALPWDASFFKKNAKPAAEAQPPVVPVAKK